MKNKGRRGLKQGSLAGCPEPQPGQTLMRVVGLRGSNIIEVEDSEGQTTLCMLPAKFHKSMWIKRGNFVIVDEGDREKVKEAGSKVTGTVAQVLYEEHIKELRKTSFWSSAFDKKETSSEDSANFDGASSQPKQPSDKDTDVMSEEEDGLPPLEANQNRKHAASCNGDFSSDSD